MVTKYKQGKHNREKEGKRKRERTFCINIKIYVKQKTFVKL